MLMTMNPPMAMTAFDQQYERVDADHYPTLDSEDVVAAMIASGLLDSVGKIWEPHAGRGHLVKSLRDAGHEVLGTDLHVYPDMLADVRSGVDFFEQHELPDGIQSIVMNPPFGTIDSHIRHALGLLGENGKLIVLARGDWGHAKRRIPLLTHPWLATRIDLMWRLKWVEGSKGSGRHNFAIWAWDAEQVGRPFYGVYHPSGAKT